ncbi:MAG TPA: Type 1 glutamine amidotransferase-like domain-containing protein [bacterium]|nr:Type 1 glutamine amidotransferase-like domain-containing protein [bacterium]
MSKIIAIGGGEIGRPGYSVETLKIDKDIIKLSGRKNPKILFIPTASSDSESYCDTFKKYFGQKLKCQVDVLYLINNNLSQKEISKKILGSDIIYVGGGNTLKMMNIWRKKGVDKILKKALNKDIVLSGISAGAICWFKYGLSDSRKFKNKDSDYIQVSGLNFINIFKCIIRTFF